MTASLVNSNTGVTAAAASTVPAVINWTPIKGNLLIFAAGMDKTTGALTTPSGWTTVLSNDSASVSIWVGYRISDGTETAATITRTNANVSGDTWWVSEWKDVASGAWFVNSTTTHYTDESIVTSWASGTTSAVPVSNGLSMAYFAIDTTNNASGGQSFSNSYSTVRAWAGTSTSGGAADIAVATLGVAAGATTSTTETHSPTGDQVSAGIFVIGRSVDLAGIGAQTAALERRRPASRRAVLRALAAPAQSVAPVQPMRRTAVRAQQGLPRRTRGSATPQTQAAVPPPVVTDRLRQTHTRRWLTPVRRARSATPVPPQVNPPMVWDRGRTGHTRRWLPPVRRAKVVLPTPPQESPIDRLRQGHTRRWLPPVRRARIGVVVPPQVPPPSVIDRLRTGHTRRWLPPVRRARAVTPTPAQLNPPYPFAAGTKHSRRWLTPVRRSSAPNPGWAQVNPPIQPDRLGPKHTRRWLTPRRRPVAAPPVPPQLNPPIPFDRLGPKLRRPQAPARRARAATAPIDQARPPALARRIAARAHQGLLWRRRPAPVGLPQQVPPVLLERSRRRPPQEPTRRGRAAAPPVPQLAPVPPGGRRSPLRVPPKRAPRRNPRPELVTQTPWTPALGRGGQHARLAVLALLRRVTRAVRPVPGGLAPQRDLLVVVTELPLGWAFTEPTPAWAVREPGTAWSFIEIKPGG